jgi:hypothetical protein
MKCSVCSGELRSDNRSGVCGVKSECRAERSKRWRREAARLMKLARSMEGER